MPWLIIVLGYLLGSIPTAYIAGRITRGVDIRQHGDANAGAANAYRVLGARVGVVVFVVDAGKGWLAVFIAQSGGLHQYSVLAVGLAAVVGHNWSIYTGFRGGRGVSTSIGVFLNIIPVPLLITGVPALLSLLLTRKSIITTAVLFAPLWLVCWLTGTPPLLIAYSIALPCLAGFTHYLRVRQTVQREKLQGSIHN